MIYETTFVCLLICKDTIKIAKMLFLIIITLNKALLFRKLNNFYAVFRIFSRNYFIYLHRIGFVFKVNLANFLASKRFFHELIGTFTQ